MIWDGGHGEDCELGESRQIDVEDTLTLILVHSRLSPPPHSRGKYRHLEDDNVVERNSEPTSSTNNFQHHGLSSERDGWSLLCILCSQEQAGSDLAFG